MIRASRNIKRIVYSASELIDGFRRIGGLPLTQDLKARIRRTYIQTIVRRKYDSHTMTANIAGYGIRFCTFRSLAYLFKEIFIDQQYHFEARKTEPFIVDCGSNIGMSVLYFKMVYPGCEILAFEPEERAFACLEANVAANSLTSIKLNKNALSNRDGQTLLFVDPAEPGSLVASTIRDRMPKESQPAMGTRLSTHIDREVDFLKVDVEGAESAILEDLTAEGKLKGIREMVIEFHHHLDPNADSLSQMLRLLEGNGFGYQIRACPRLPFRRRQFQDILVHAYRKGD